MDWAALSRSGRLLFAKVNDNNVLWSESPYTEEFTSIVKYDGGNVHVRTKSGEIKEIPIKANINLCCSDPNIIEDNFTYDPIHMCNGFLCRGIEIITKEQVTGFTKSKPARVTLADDSEILFDELINCKSQHHYCKNGMLEHVDDIVKHISLMNYMVFTSASGNVYAMRKYFVYQTGKILANGDSFLFLSDGLTTIGIKLNVKLSGVFEDICFINKMGRVQLLVCSVLIDIPDAIEIVQHNDIIEITTTSGKISTSLSDVWTKRITAKRITCQCRPSYYIDGDSNLIDMRNDMYSFTIKEIEGKYYDSWLEQLPILGKFLSSEGFLIDISYLSKINETYIINKNYVILSKHAMDIEHVSINDVSDLYPLKITTKTGGVRAAALFTSIGPLVLSRMCLIFENSEQWPLMEQTPLEYYSPAGKYTKVPQSEIISIHRAIYIIRGNYVLFDNIKEGAIIYESFGTFMVLEDNCVHIGMITINKPHSHTKPAICS